MRKFTVEVLTKFPARVDAGAGIGIAKANGVYTFSADYDSVAETGVTDPSNSYVLVQQPDGTYAKVPISTLPTMGGDAEVTATGSTESRALSDRFADILSILDFGGVADYEPTTDVGTDCSPALSAALDYAASRGFLTLHFPAGKYVFRSLVSKTGTSYSLHLRGAGMQVTNLYAGPANTTGFLQINPTSRSTQCTLSNFTLWAMAPSQGIGIEYTTDPHGNQHHRSLIIEYVDLQPYHTAFDYFYVPLNFTGCFRPLLSNVSVAGPFGPTVPPGDDNPCYVPPIGINLNDCYGPEISQCNVWLGSVGISSISTETPGPEGFRISDSNIVGLIRGVHFARVGNEPTFWAERCHINCRQNQIIIDGATQIFLSDMDYYNVDTVPYQVGNCVDVIIKGTSYVGNITNSTHWFSGNLNRIGLYLDGTTYCRNFVVSNLNFLGHFSKAIVISDGAFGVDVINVIIGSTDGVNIPVGIEVGATATKVSLTNIRQNNIAAGVVTKLISDLSGKAVIVDRQTDGIVRNVSQSASAGAAPVFQQVRQSPVPAVNDVIGAWDSLAFNSALAETKFAGWRTLTRVLTPGAETGQVQLFVTNAGAQTLALTVDNLGFSIPGTTTMPLRVGTALVLAGTGSPQSVVAAPVGSLFLRTDGGALTSLYVKETGGATNAGWVAK